MTSVFSWQTLLAFAPCYFVLQGQICLLLQVFLDFLLFAFQSPIMKRTSFLGAGSRRSCRSSQNRSMSASSVLLIGAQTWITVILNGLLWKRTEIILLFLRLHPSTAFRTVLLTIIIKWKWLIDLMYQTSLNTRNTMDGGL